jgi:hypothetical protein
MDGQENDLCAAATLPKISSHIQSAQLFYENVEHHNIGFETLAFTHDRGPIAENSDDLVHVLPKKIADVIEHSRIVIGEN